MKKSIKYLRLVLSFLLTIPGIGNAAPKPILWSYKQLKEIKKDPFSKSEWDQIIEYANHSLSQPYISVIGKTKSFCANPHYYSSIGIYWWPDISCSQGNDNTATCYDVLLLNMSLFSGQKERAKQLIIDLPIKRIQTQIDDNGRFPRELTRTKAYYYSVYNLSHIVDFVLLAETLGYDLYWNNKAKIDSAMGYLSYFVSDRESFNYIQINDWENSVQMLFYQIDRLSNESKASKHFSCEPMSVLKTQLSQRLKYIINYE